MQHKGIHLFHASAHHLEVCKFRLIQEAEGNYIFCDGEATAREIFGDRIDVGVTMRSSLWIS